MLCYSSESNPPYFWDNLILFHAIPNSGQKQDKVGQNIFNYVLSIVAIVESILSDIPTYSASFLSHTLKFGQESF